MRLLRWSEVVWLGALAAACSEEPAAPAECETIDPVQCADEIELSIGTGDPELADFEPLPDGGDARLFSGEQGGYHVFLQLRSRGICSSEIVFERKLRVPGDDRVIRSQGEILSLVDQDAGWSILPRSQPTFVCPSNAPGVSMDRPLEMEVTVTEQRCAEEARSVTRTFPLLPECADGDVICTDDSLLGCAAP